MDKEEKTLYEILEELCSTIHSSIEGNEWAKRMGVAMFFGYYDAKMMRYFRETHGLSLVDQLIFLRKKYPDIKVPYDGLKCELAWMGKKPSSIAAELKELREFDTLEARAAAKL